MQRRPKIFDILLQSKELSADLALVAGLAEIEPPLQAEIVRTLLERGHEAGLKSLPALFHKLTPESKALVLANTSRLSPCLRSTVRASEVQTRLNTVEIIRQSGNLRLVYLAAHAVHDSSLQIRAEAAATVQHLTNRHCSNYAETTAILRDAAEPDDSISKAVVQTLKLLRDERRCLTAALADALNTYESHHRPEVLEAAMFLADELEKELFQHSTVKRGKLTHAMQGIYGNAPSPHLAAFTYVALCYPELRKRVVHVLANHRDADFFAQLIRHHWLAKDPNIQKNLLTVRSVAWLEDGLEAAFALPPEAAAKAPAWLMTLGLPSDRRASLLLNFLLLDNPAANRAAAWALTRIDTPAATLALQSVLEHDDDSVRTLAEREISFRTRRDQHRLHRQRKDRPDDWVTLLDRAGLAEEFDDFWHHFERFHPVQARIAGHLATKYVPGFTTQLQVRLLSTQAADRLRALRLIGILNLAAQFQNEAFNTANDSSPEIRAAAMPILAQIGDATSRRIIERAVNDDDTAVQAAAVEALDQVGSKRRPELLKPKTESEDANVRAAAIRSLLKLRVTEAVPALLSMLHDPRPNHRVAALWIADQLRLVSLAPRVTEIADKDPDQRIARIAHHVAKRLERLKVRSGSTAKPEPVEA